MSPSPYPCFRRPPSARPPTSRYMLAAWARMCEILVEDFLPYLDFVMGPLMQSVQLKPEFVVVRGRRRR